MVYIGSGKIFVKLLELHIVPTIYKLLQESLETGLFTPSGCLTSSMMGFNSI